MVRTQIYLSEEEQAALEKMSEESGKSKSEIIRAAIDAYIVRSGGAHRRAVLARAAGLWKDHPNPPDLAELRRSWDRRRSR